MIYSPNDKNFDFNRVYNSNEIYSKGWVCVQHDKERTYSGFIEIEFSIIERVHVFAKALFALITFSFSKAKELWNEAYLQKVPKSFNVKVVEGFPSILLFNPKIEAITLCGKVNVPYFKNMSIFHWLDPDKEGWHKASFHLEDAEYDALNKKILERIDIYNREIGFMDRIEALKERPSICMQDLESSWENSVIRFAFLTKEELMDLDLNELTDIQFTHVCKNEKHLRALVQPKLQACAERLAKVAPECLDLLTVEQIQSLQFSEKMILGKRDFILSMLPEQIVEALNNQLFTKDSARFVSREQIEKIKFTAINCKKVGIDTISALFRDWENHIERCKTSAIPLSDLHHVIPYMRCSELAQLSVEQLQSLDFSKITETKFTSIAIGEEYGSLIRQMLPHQVEAAFNNNCFTKLTIPCLSSKQVEEALNKGLLTKEIALKIEKSQLEGIDLSQYKDKEVYEILYSTQNT